MMNAIDAERATAIVPAWPWRPLSVLLRHAPIRLFAWLTGPAPSPARP